MKKVKIILTFLLIINSLFAFSQQPNNSIKYISFHFYHAMRIPYSEVTIEIFKKKKNAIVKVNSKAADNDKEWDYSRINNKFEIDLKTFEELSNKIVTLQTMNFQDDNGADGNTCIIEFKNGNQNFKYNVWTPDYNTEKRGLTYFLEQCNELILLGKLDPKEIFRKKGSKSIKNGIQ